MRWRGTPLMKNVFDFAMYPALIAELRPRTVFEIGSGLGASAAWFADNLALCGIEGRVHSVDLVKAGRSIRASDFHQGDCSEPERLFDADLLRAEPHPWLVVEDAHHNVGRGTGAVSRVPVARRLSGGRRQRRETRRASGISSPRIPATIWSTRDLPIISAAMRPAPPISIFVRTRKCRLAAAWNTAARLVQSLFASRTTATR